MLRALAPRAQVIDNRVFVVDGPLASSAGITAGIDVALHLIAEECGEALAASVAEDMVVYLRRSPRDTELSPFQMHRRHLHPTVHRVQDAIVTDPQRDWDMASLARVGHAAERHLLRLFIDHAGISPLHYLRLIRLERARQSLEYGATVTRAAAAAGFALRPAAAPRLEPPVGRVAPRYDPRGGAGRSDVARTAHHATSQPVMGL